MRFTQFTTVENSQLLRTRGGRGVCRGAGPRSGHAYRPPDLHITFLFPLLEHASHLSLAFTWKVHFHIPSPYFPNVLSSILQSPPVGIFASMPWLILVPCIVCKTFSFSLWWCKSYPGSPFLESPTLQCHLCPESWWHLLLNNYQVTFIQRIHCTLSNEVHTSWT